MVSAWSRIHAKGVRLSKCKRIPPGHVGHTRLHLSRHSRKIGGLAAAGQPRPATNTNNGVDPSISSTSLHATREDSTLGPDDIRNEPSQSVTLSANNPALPGLLLAALRQSNTADAAWDAFQQLTSLLPPKRLMNASLQSSPDTMIPRDVRRLISQLTKEKPRTRKTFIRMLEVFRFMQVTGVEIDTWEWNTLIDCAGKGFRRTREEDYRAALDVFQDMRAATLEKRNRAQSRQDSVAFDNGSNADDITEVGNIVTYTTLLAIAVRSRSPDTLRHASQLLRHSQLPPSRITELSVLPHLGRNGELHAAKAVIENVHAKGLTVGMDGLNSLMWVFASNGSLELPLGIYRFLRPKMHHDQTPTQLQNFPAIGNIGTFPIPADLLPDRATYTLLIQCLAYHGHFVLALEVFRDLMALPRPPEPTQNRRSSAEGESPNAYLLPVYRAMFLGFSRHGRPQKMAHEKVVTLPAFAARLIARQPIRGLTPWNTHNLTMIFNMFLESAQDLIPGERTLYWILTAFAKTSKNSMAKMTDVWKHLDAHFRPAAGWRGRMRQLNEKFGKGGSTGAHSR